MKYQLTEEAARDVEEILAYSVNSFGVKQTEHYFEALTDYARHGILIRFVGTHKQYDEIKDIDNI